MVRKKAHADLDLWPERACTSLVASFANGVTKDKAAINAAITTCWSNGQTEGQITKLKLVNTSFTTAVVVRPIEKEGEYAWVVVAGFHRIEAAKAAGQADVHVIVVENATDLELELIEIDENILHRPLTIVQEARALARRKEIYQQLNPSTKRGGDRRANNQSGSLKSFAQATAN